MSQVIIFEGADRIGKTTLINRISAELKKNYTIKIMHCGGTTSKNPFNAQKTKFYKNYRKCMNDKVDIILMDRGYLGEIIYSKIFSRKYPNYFSNLHSLMKRDCNVYHFICVGKPILKNMTQGDKEMIPRHNEISMAFLAAAMLIEKNDRYLLKFPVDNTEYDNIVKIIISIYKGNTKTPL
jgi:hypothetical protein